MNSIPTPAQHFALCLARISHRLNTYACWWVIIALITMSILIGVQVFFRYVLNNSLFWSEEVGRILLVQITFIGSSIAVRAGAHPGMDALLLRIPSQYRYYISLGVLFFSFLFFMALAYYGAQFSWFIQHQVTPTLSISRAIPVLPLVLGAALSALHTVTALLCLGTKVAMLEQPHSTVTPAR